MEKLRKSGHYINIIRYAGIYIGAVIGAGFASGQEPLQFFAGYGYKGIIGAVLVIILFTWYGTLFMELGHQLQTTSHKEILVYLCGKYLGGIFDWMLTFFLFGVYAIMISGGGSALNQHFGVDLFVGKVLITILTLITVFLGFSSALNALGFLSPLIIITTIGISIATLLMNIDGLSTVEQSIEQMNIATATSQWWISALIYVSYCVLPTIPALASVGNVEPNINVARKSGMIGGLLLSISVLLMVLALLSSIENVAGYEIPFLEVANQMHANVGFAFAFILLAAIYTTAVPILYGFSSRFAKPGTGKFKMLTVIAAITAFLSGLFPFSSLVGTIYPLLGYIGLVVMVCGLYHTFFRKRKM